MSFQICISFCLLQRAKDDIWKCIGNQTTLNLPLTFIVHEGKLMTEMYFFKRPLLVSENTFSHNAKLNQFLYSVLQFSLSSVFHFWLWLIQSVHLLQLFSRAIVLKEICWKHHIEIQTRAQHFAQSVRWLFQTCHWNEFQLMVKSSLSSLLNLLIGRSDPSWSCHVGHCKILSSGGRKCRGSGVKLDACKETLFIVQPHNSETEATASSLEQNAGHCCN